MSRLVESVKRPRFRLRRYGLPAAVAGLLAFFVAGAAGAAQPSFVLTGVVAAGSHVVDIAVDDFNGDGTPDLAVASWSLDSHDINVLLGDGAGGFRPGPMFARQDRRPARLFTADFNGDGKIDLAVSQRDKVFYDQVRWVSILLGDGAGRLSAAAGLPLELAGLAAVSDVNGDGKTDLVLLQERKIAVLLGDGSGRFAPAPGSPFAAGTRGKTVAVADFNGDGKPDLAVAGEEGLSVLLGTSSGRFAAARRVTRASGPLAVADFNSDKKPDLVVADTKLSILLGDGTGALSPAPGSPFKGDYRDGIATADFNGDGKSDLAAATDNSVVVLLGDGASHVHRAAASFLGLTLPFHPSLLAAIDLNNDGRLDLLARATADRALRYVAEEGENRLALLLQGPSVQAPTVLHGGALAGAPKVLFTTPGTITKLAADGDRAAAMTTRAGGCAAGRVVVWTASSRKATEVRLPARGCFASEMAVGDGRVAWITAGSAGNTQGWLNVFAAKLSGGAATPIDGSARARSEFGSNALWMGHLLGGGPLLAYNRWRTACVGSPPDYGCSGSPPDPWLRVGTTSLVRVVAGRRVVARRGADSYRLAAVGGGRMAVESSDGVVAVLASSGRRAATIPAPNGSLPQSIALSRTRLAVVRWSGTLELYNPGGGTKTKSLTLGAAATLELAGVNAKLALLRGPQRLVLVRLSDGVLLSLPRHAVIDPTLTEAGLFYAYNLPRAREGRIVFEPTAALLERFT